MKHLITIALFFWTGLGWGQDTTFIVSWGGLNSEHPINVHQVKSGVLAVSNTGSFGAGSSDLYFTVMSNEAAIDTSWTYGGVTEDIGIGSISFNDKIAVLGYSNSFDDQAYSYFVLIYDTNFTLINSIQPSWEFDKTMHPQLMSSDEGFTLCGRVGDNFRMQFFSEEGEIMSTTSFPLTGNGETAQLIVNEHVLVCGKDSLGENNVVFLLRYNLSNAQSEYSIIDTVRNAQVAFLLKADTLANFYIVYNYKRTASSSYNIQMIKLNDELDTIWTEGYVWPMDDRAIKGFVNGQHELTFIGTINSFGEGGDFGLGRWDSSGNFVDLRTLGSSSLDEGAGIVSNDNDGYWLFGKTFGFQSALSDLLIYHTNSIGITFSNDFEKLEDNLFGTLGLNSWEVLNEDYVSFYPNPFQQDLKIYLKRIPTRFHLDLFDSLGRKVFEAYDYQNGYDVTHIQKGAYYYVVYLDGITARGKLVKQ